jgi:hypothetical protein
VKTVLIFQLKEGIIQWIESRITAKYSTIHSAAIPGSKRLIALRWISPDLRFRFFPANEADNVGEGPVNWHL